MSSENEYHRTVAISSEDTVRDLIGVFLLLIFALLTIGTILAPDLMGLLDQAWHSHGVVEWVSALGSLLLIGLLIMFPIFLLVLRMIRSRKARL